jgi:hypothetical protein
MLRSRGEDIRRQTIGSVYSLLLVTFQYEAVDSNQQLQLCEIRWGSD